MSIRTAFRLVVTIVALSGPNSGKTQAAPADDGADTQSPQVRWVVTDDFEKDAPHNPLVVNDKVIVGTDLGMIRAYRCRDGKPAWVYEHGGQVFHRPCSNGQRVYFGSKNGVACVNADDESKVWSLSEFSGDGPTFVLPEKKMVYLGSSDGNLYALDSGTGELVWARDFITDAPQDPPGFLGTNARFSNTKARPSALASDGETLYLSVFDQSRIVAFDATNGDELWSFQADGWIFGAAVATKKHVYFGSQDKRFYCLDKRTGRKVWSYETKARIESGGTVDADSVYFGSCDGGLYSLDRSSGELRWRFAADPRGKRNTPIYSVPILAQERAIFAAGEGQAYAVDTRTGQLKWKIRPSEGSELFCSPASDGRLYFLVTRPTDAEHGTHSLLAIDWD